jgi:hypothetical protein
MTSPSLQPILPVTSLRIKAAFNHALAGCTQSEISETLMVSKKTLTRWGEYIYAERGCIPQQFWTQTDIKKHYILRYINDFSGATFTEILRGIRNLYDVSIETQQLRLLIGSLKKEHILKLERHGRVYYWDVSDAWDPALPISKQAVVPS